jgi:hypothetical protein
MDDPALRERGEGCLMDWNDTLTLLIAADTILNAKLLVGGWLVMRWWKQRKKGRTEDV